MPHADSYQRRKRPRRIAESTNENEVDSRIHLARATKKGVDPGFQPGARSPQTIAARGRKIMFVPAARGNPAGPAGGWAGSAFEGAGD